MKYNFVIFALDFYCYETAYFDVISLENVQYIPNYRPIRNKIVSLIYRIHHSGKINNIVKVPFKRIWFPNYFKNNFTNEKPICFLFFGRNLDLVSYGYISFLKKKYPNSRYVCFFQDLISTHKNNDIPYIKKIFDLVISYDKIEAKKYQILYHPTVYSKFPVEKNCNFPTSDVFFLGAAKDRLQKILTIYQHLKKINLECDFYITGVSIKDQLPLEGIHYINEMSYLENLEHVNSTKCILEIMQDNAQGHTMRTWEAIMYNKKLLTDNSEIKKAPFYNQMNILVFENVNDILNNRFFFNDFSRDAEYNYKDEINPINLLDFISNNLSN